MLDSCTLTSAFAVCWFAPGRFTGQLQGWTSLPYAHPNRCVFGISSDLPGFQWGIWISESVVLSSYTARYSGLERCGGRKA